MPAEPVLKIRSSPSMANCGCHFVPLEAKVASAVTFLHKAQAAFAKDPGNPDKYSQLLRYLQDYRDGLIDISQVMTGCSNLFNQHQHLIPAFNSFLPQGWSIISHSPCYSRLYSKRLIERHKKFVDSEFLHILKSLQDRLGSAEGLRGDKCNNFVELLTRSDFTAEDTDANYKKFVGLLKDDASHCRAFEEILLNHFRRRPSSCTLSPEINLEEGLATSVVNLVSEDDPDLEMTDHTLTPSPSATLYSATPPSLGKPEAASRKGRLGSIGPVRTTTSPMAPPRFRRSYRTRPYRTPSPKLDTQSVSSASPSTTASGDSDSSEATTVTASSPASLLPKKKKGRFAFLDEDNEYPPELLSSNRPVDDPIHPVVLSSLSLPFYPTLCDDKKHVNSSLGYSAWRRSEERGKSMNSSQQAPAPSTMNFMDKFFHQQDLSRRGHNATSPIQPSLKEKFCSTPNVVGPPPTIKIYPTLGQIETSEVSPSISTTSTTSTVSNTSLRDTSYPPVLYPFDVINGRRTYLDAVKSPNRNGSQINASVEPSSCIRAGSIVVTSDFPHPHNYGMIIRERASY
ncbi:hypothetical protein FRC03_002196 [Tulasnella sp. 419]|nr:hypothetical protein FRC03_002196 [Tulasnella sp. 419]